MSKTLQSFNVPHSEKGNKTIVAHTFTHICGVIIGCIILWGKLCICKKGTIYLTVPSEDAVNSPLSSLDQQRSYTTLRWPLKEARTFPDGISYTKNRDISLNYIQEYSICRN